MTRINPIFVDRSVGARDYSHLGNDQLLITKVFPTVQGEGPFAGNRCVFVRLAGCNYGGKGLEGPGCDFCDTDFRFDKGSVMSFVELEQEIGRVHPHSIFPTPSTPLVVITGGEPMLQNNLVGFINRNVRRYIFQIESNGTRLLDIPDLSCYLVVSPKIIVNYKNAKAMPSTRDLRYPTLSKRVFDRADYLKYVVSADENNPYHYLPNEAYDFLALNKSVYVSPMAVYKKPPHDTASIWDPEVFDQKACAANHAYAAYLAQRNGFKMSVQMHLYCGVE